MAHRKRIGPRTPSQVAADDQADQLARQVGRMLKGMRLAGRSTQAAASAIAGLPRGTYGTLEARGKAGVTLRTLSRAALGVGGELHVYVAQASAADQPRDAVQLRNQELILRFAEPGGWAGVPEAALDRSAGTSRALDVLLHRHHEWAMFEVWDWFADVGASLRDWDRRLGALEAYAIARMPLDEPGAEPRLPVVGGCWVVRATKRNRQLVADHRHVFRARFPGSAQAWLEALQGDRPMPARPALLWVRVNGSALFASRLG